MPVTNAKTKSVPETRPVLFITYAYDDTQNAPVLDVSGSLKAARRWMRGQGQGFCYRVERLGPPDDEGTYTYGNETFVEVINP